MTHPRLNRIIAAAVFVVAMAVYILTLSPTVVFWDVGEFIAAAKMLQVPHPPGSPLFLLVTRVAMMIPFAADQAVRAHAFSAFFSALGDHVSPTGDRPGDQEFRGVPRDAAGPGHRATARRSSAH